MRYTDIARIANGMNGGVSAMERTSMIKARRPIVIGCHPIVYVILSLVICMGRYTIKTNGKKMITRTENTTLYQPVFQRLSFKWSPGLTFSSIIRTPQPLNGAKWFSAVLALAPQAQQNSYLQNAHVMWLQPPFFSILVLHMGQKDTFPLVSEIQPSSCLFMASSQVTSSPCHSFLQSKHTNVWHLGHCNFFTLIFAGALIY